jgi:two-component system, cell cycle sensor histidine kinase and response regulator CckA
MSTQRDDEAWVGELLDKLDIGAFQIDNVTERVVRINAACARLYGFAKPEDAVGHSALDMYEDPKERREVATRFVATEEFRRTGIARLEGRRVRIDTREPFDAQICLKATLDAAGRPVFLEGTITKLGAPSAKDDAFRIGEQRFRALFDTTTVPMALAQVNGTLSRVNAAFCRFLARDEASLLGASLFSFMHEGDRAASADERRFARGDGETAWGQMTWSPITDDQGNQSAVVVVQDVTARKRVEQNLLRVAKLESLGVLAGGIAHDFNNVLAVVLGNLSLAGRQEDIGPGTRTLLAEAEQAASRARDLAKQLVTFAKGGTPVKRVGSIVPVLREAVSFCARVVSRDVTFEETLPSDLWLVDIDAEQMNQVFHNVLLNAAQAMPSGGRIHIDAENIALERGAGVPLSPGRYVCVRVIDQGSGIDQKHIDRIFDPYFTTKSSGTGLGLATAHSIITRHDGHLTVKSTLGEGATFIVFLPASDAALVPGRAEPAAATRGRERILLMDDDEDVRRMTKRVLESSGFEVVDCSDGAAAVTEFDRARAAGDPFRAVVLDLVVRAGVGGVETLVRLRAMDPSVKAIVVSGYSDDPVMADCRRFGFVEAVAKPFAAGEIGEAIGRALGGR